MNSRLLLSFGLLVGVLSTGGTIFAHHGAAAFENTVLVLKEATVTKYLWANPHTLSCST